MLCWKNQDEEGRTQVGVIGAASVSDDVACHVKEKPAHDVAASQLIIIAHLVRVGVGKGGEATPIASIEASLHTETSTESHCLYAVILCAIISTASHVCLCGQGLWTIICLRNVYIQSTWICSLFLQQCFVHIRPTLIQYGYG